MNDMSQVIAPKSDQVNADDLIAGPRTYTIEGVDIRPGTEQPVNIKLAGEDRVWRPCKSMSRVLVSAWGPDAKVYAGRSVTLYRDPKVKWGGMEVGGIRISHLSHIEREMLLQLTATKGKRAPHIVKPLAIEKPKPAEDGAAKWTNGFCAKVQAAPDRVALEQLIEAQSARLAELEAKRPELHRTCAATIDAAARAAFEPEGRAEQDMGEGFTDTDQADWAA